MTHNWKHPEEADEAWSLQHSVAMVITAPKSLYDPSRPNYDQRWEDLVERFLHELESFPDDKFLIPEGNLSRSHYGTAPWATGGMFPELTEVLTVFRDVNEVVQNLSGWIGLADLMEFLPAAWQRAQEAVGEGGDVEISKPPLPSIPGIKAICISDMVRNFGIEDMPQITIDSRHFGRGAPGHPTWETRYCVLARIGQTVPQTFLYLLSGGGTIVEKIRIEADEPIGVSFLTLGSD